MRAERGAGQPARRRPAAPARPTRSLGPADKRPESRVGGDAQGSCALGGGRSRCAKPRSRSVGHAPAERRPGAVLAAAFPRPAARIAGCVTARGNPLPSAARSGVQRHRSRSRSQEPSGARCPGRPGARGGRVVPLRLEKGRGVRGQSADTNAPSLPPTRASGRIAVTVRCSVGTREAGVVRLYPGKAAPNGF